MFQSVKRLQVFSCQQEVGGGSIWGVMRVESLPVFRGNNLIQFLVKRSLALIYQQFQRFSAPLNDRKSQANCIPHKKQINQLEYLSRFESYV